MADDAEPRTEPVSLCSLAISAVIARHYGSEEALMAALTALERHLGPLAVKAIEAHAAAKVLGPE